VCNLSWKLACVLSGQSPLHLLDSYETERRYRVLANTHIALWLSHLIASRSKVFAFLRDLFLPYITLGVFRRYFQRDVFIAGTALIAQLRGPPSSFPCRHLIGQPLPFHDTHSEQMMKGSFCLLSTHKEDLNGVDTSALPHCRLLVCDWIPVRSILVRPDRHIMSAWSCPPPQDCLVHLAKCLETPFVDGEMSCVLFLKMFGYLRVFTPW